MFIELKPDDPRAVYRQIADEVQRAVATGVLRPGDPLPASRQLAGELKVNTNTVQHAYRTIVREGLAEVRKGLGTFIVAAPRESRQRPALLARQIAERALREAFRHGLLASDLIAALSEIAPTRPDR
ncbi:MAG TPA: GntR family transcriptional regulator [Vicinamibacterales bacterium]|nr:GntR family transcriptional regulator [Vicinamibacterales bacterium]